MTELTPQSTSIQTLYSWYRESKLFVNRRYQRKLVWTLNEKQKLIESILNKYPIPAIIIAERDSQAGSYEIIDGLQRLQAILSYIETSFPSLEDKYFDVKSFPTANKNAEDGLFEITDKAKLLSAKEISVFLDYTIALSVMRNTTESEINDVFDRINTYGHRLSDQERRQAGVQNPFSEMVRNISCIMRGDSSQQNLPLYLMPSISIDLPKTKHGYQVQAEEVFWVKQGILRSTELRDSMDEQAIADIAACIIGGTCIERSKDALDKIYSKSDPESERILSALQVYGAEKYTSEFMFDIEEVVKVCNSEGNEILRNILFEDRNTNAYPSMFAVLIMAFHELLIKENKMITSYNDVKRVLNNLSRKIETGQKGASADERRKSIDQVKGLIGSYFIPNDKNPRAFSGNTTADIDATIRRSEIELANYELKQGILSLSDGRALDSGMLDKIVHTIAAISNNGKRSSGKLFIGVTDKESDAARIESIDGVKSIRIGNRSVVGINREAKKMGIDVERYVSIIKDAIKKSELTDSIKANVLSHLDYNNYYGLGVLVIEIPEASEMAFIGEDVYWREGDSTKKASEAKIIASIAKRF